MKNKEVNQIQIIENQLEKLEGFNDRQRSMIIARTQTRIKEVDQDTIEDRIVNIIQKTFLESGRRRPIDQAEVEAQQQDDFFLSITLIKDLQRDFKFLTIQDVDNAFSMGVRGEFGKFHGINIKTFYEWLKSYDERRRQVIKLFEQKKNQTKMIEAPKRKRHEMEPEELQPAFDMVQDHIIEHETLPVVADWLSVYWYLSKTDQVKPITKDEKLNGLFNKYVFKHIQQRTEKKGIKAIDEIVQGLENKSDGMNMKRQIFAKFFFVHTFKIKS